MINTELMGKAKVYAVKCHADTNHKYNGMPYDFHLQMVVDYAKKYAYHLDDADILIAISAAWAHDVIEDCRQTYNDVKTALGKDVADVVYALTNEKGRNRKERANASYYSLIRITPLATFVKLCDRLANAKYSKDTGSSMLEAYKKEHEHFRNCLVDLKYRDMWEELEGILDVREP